MKTIFLLASVSALILQSSATSYPPNAAVITTTVTNYKTVCPCDTTTFTPSATNIASSGSGIDDWSPDDPTANSCGVVGNDKDDYYYYAIDSTYGKSGSDCQQYCKSSPAASFMWDSSKCYCYRYNVATIVNPATSGNTYYDIGCQLGDSTPTTMVVGEASPTAAAASPTSTCNVPGTVKSFASQQATSSSGDPFVCHRYCLVNYNNVGGVFVLYADGNCFCFTDSFANLYEPDPYYADEGDEAGTVWDMSCDVGNGSNEEDNEGGGDDGDGGADGGQFY